MCLRKRLRPFGKHAGFPAQGLRAQFGAALLPVGHNAVHDGVELGTMAWDEHDREVVTAVNEYLKQ